ncbi:MAG: arginine--tRNA ligase [Candidatus Neomarinimicrobiota bacterium]
MKNLKSLLHNNIDSILEDLYYPKVKFSIIPSKDAKFGDLSSNVALLLTKDLKKNPLDICEIILKELSNKNLKSIAQITITKPGFINFKIKNSFLQSKITKILIEKDNYGKNSIGKRKTANVEFVSANPTGPLTIGHGRNAILGDSISNILEWNGYKVTREYYFNNAGRQMRMLGNSVKARYFEILGKDHKFPEDGYQGDYIKNIAKQIIKKHGKNLTVESLHFKKEAERIIFNQIKKSLKKLKIHFDQFSNEKTFYENGDIEDMLSKLTQKKLLYKKEGATWFKATALGKEQDRVYIKKSGEPTYRVPDTAYHKNKIDRGFDLIIDIFGTDHADAYPDVICALDALNLKTDHIKVLLYQFVTLIKNGKKYKMSTRKANFITIDELIQEVGPDVIRYFFIMRSMNTHLDFDLDLAKDQSDKNPVFYLQYAYARISSIIRRGNELGMNFNNNKNYNLLSHSRELELIKHMIKFPNIIENSLKTFEPQNLANYLQDLATRFHKFYAKCRVLTNDVDVSSARLDLILSVKYIMGNGLKILGISAPEKM